MSLGNKWGNNIMLQFQAKMEDLVTIEDMVAADSNTSTLMISSNILRMTFLEISEIWRVISVTISTAIFHSTLMQVVELT